MVATTDVTPEVKAIAPEVQKSGDEADKSEKMRKVRGRGKGKERGKGREKVKADKVEASDKVDTIANSEKGDEEEKHVVIDGTARVQVSANRYELFYNRACRLIFAGYTRRGDLWPYDKVDRLEITGYGRAVGEAVRVADELKRSKVVTVEKMSLEYFNVTEKKEIPKATVYVRKEPSWDPENDRLLKTSHAWKRVLKKSGKEPEKLVRKP